MTRKSISCSILNALNSRQTDFEIDMCISKCSSNLGSGEAVGRTWHQIDVKSQVVTTNLASTYTSLEFGIGTSIGTQGREFLMKLKSKSENGKARCTRRRAGS